MKTFRTKQYGRDGVTIIEVLTSIIVAVIGVAGVLVLIPFGIRQAQTGLDLQDTTTLAQNAVQDFQVRRYSQVDRFQGSPALPWINVGERPLENAAPHRGDFLQLVSMVSDPQDPIGWFLIDPLWLNAMTDPSNVDNQYPNPALFNAMFNYVGTRPDLRNQFFDGIPNGNLFDVPPAIPRYVQLLDLSNPLQFEDGSGNPLNPPIVNPIQFGLADRIFRSRDDIQFAVEKYPDGTATVVSGAPVDISGTEIDPRLPPGGYVDQIIDLDTGLPVNTRRQFEGSVSWSAVAVPKRGSGNVNLLDPLNNGGAGHRIEGFDFYVMVYKDRSFESPVAFTPERDPRFIFTTLTSAQNNLDIGDPPIGNPFRITGTGTVSIDAPAADIRNDEWVMLLNFGINGESQVGFYRVIGSYVNPNGGVFLTLDGSDFQIFDQLNGEDFVTYVVYLPNVVNVFKRQLQIEGDFGS